MATHNAEPAELGRFLRSRRERLDPAGAGFPAGARRRSPGLRREEVAVLAGISPTWYAYLEQGRDVRPSVELLDSLARALRLSEDERRYAHVLVHGHVARPRPLVGDTSAEELVECLVAAAADDPHPVHAVGRHGDVLAWNAASAAWYDDWGALPVTGRNLLAWLLTSPVARERVVDWEDEARDAVAAWRAEVARAPGDEEVARRVAELSAASTRFRHWWDERIVRERRSRVRRFRRPGAEVRELRLVPVESPEFAPATVVLHLPL
ncbi:helix-turn-helix transcriptional regulator [Saccharothrix sp. Mg75]|uniref:helix-turn-helix transcriptional regulator n=1 Tax=Saccharothrix sp. Mg75 TaxID=3445357 RepID=UPI003EE93E80